MANMWLKIGGLSCLACLVGCVPDEDTSPSAALFPAAHYGAVRPDFSGQLASRASRHDVELYALFGVGYTDQDKRELKPVEEALSQGYYTNPANGKKIFRIQTFSQAQQLLGDAWYQEKWTKDSALASKFRATPNASVAVIGQKDQRILFFDQSNHLMEVYPKAG